MMPPASSPIPSTAATSPAQPRPAGLAPALTGGAGGAPPDAADAALVDAATRFEALILGEMLRAMRRATTGSGLIRREAEQSFRELQERIWAEGLARVAPIGLVARLPSRTAAAAAPAGPAALAPVAAPVVAAAAMPALPTGPQPAASLATGAGPLR